MRFHLAYCRWQKHAEYYSQTLATRCAFSRPLHAPRRKLLEYHKGNQPCRVEVRLRLAPFLLRWSFLRWEETHFCGSIPSPFFVCRKQPQYAERCTRGRN